MLLFLAQFWEDFKRTCPMKEKPTVFPSTENKIYQSVIDYQYSLIAFCSKPCRMSSRDSIYEYAHIHGVTMDYLELASKLKISQNMARNMLSDRGTSPSLRSLPFEDIKEIYRRGTEREGRTNFSQLRPEEWSKVFGQEWEKIRRCMRLVGLGLYSAKMPILEIRALFLCEPTEDEPGDVSERFMGVFSHNLARDRCYRPTLVRSNGDGSFSTILGLNETQKLMRDKTKGFKAHVSQWERLVPGITPFLTKRRDGFYETTEYVEVIRKKIRQSPT